MMRRAAPRNPAKLRRAVRTAAAAVALSLAPAAAITYAAAPASAASSVSVSSIANASYSLSTSSTANAAAGTSLPAADSQTTGVPFNVRASGAKANESVTLTITRQPASSGTPARSLTRTANAKGVAQFSVTLADDGTYALVSTSASGATLSTQSVTVVLKGSVIVAGEAADAPAEAGASGATGAPGETGTSGETVAGSLAVTGPQNVGLAGGGGVLVVVGVGLVLLTRGPRPVPVRA